MPWNCWTCWAWSMLPAMPVDLPAGNAAHFIVRFSPAEYRDDLKAAFAFGAELQESIERCSDPGVTRLKLDWWRREIDHASNSNHPLVRRLAALASEASGLDAMHAMLDATEADILKQQPSDTRAFIEQCDRVGALARLLCLASAQRLPGPEPLGRYAAAVHRIQHLGRHLQRDHNPLPRDLGLPGDPAAWKEERLAAACAALLDPLRESAEQVLRDRAINTLPARRWANQARTVHRLLEREHYPVQRMFMDITPFSRLWNTWRVR